MSPRRILAAVAFGMLAAASAAAHEGARARVTLSPDRPQVGASCRVVVVADDATTLGRWSRRVWLRADMPMHVMRPIEAELHRTDDPNVYTGEIVFTMPGPWRVELRLEDVGETMRAAFETRVLHDDQPAEAGIGQHVLDLEDAARPTVLPPAYVLGGAVALTLLMQAVAVVLARGRSGHPPGGVRPQSDQIDTARKGG